MSAKNKHTVKVGRVSIQMWLHRDGWRFAYTTRDGETKYITRKDKADAIDEARAKATEINNGAVDLSSLEADKVSILQRVLDLNMTHTDLDEWEKSRKFKAVTALFAVNEFLAIKRANKGLSERNVRSLSGDLGGMAKALPEGIMLRDVTVQHLEAWLKPVSGKRRRRNLRGSAVTFFRWARRREYLPDKITAGEKLESPRITRKVPETYTPEELALMLPACPEAYIPWLSLSAFAGVRLEELFVDPRSDKSPLDWSDIKWDQDVTIVRPETAKTGDRRIIPILPALRELLWTRRKVEGRIVPMRPPHWQPKGKTSVTAQLGALVGGWRANALRHSFISYRAAEVGLAQTAMEAGNSEAEARRSYNDAKTKDEAVKWFSVRMFSDVENGKIVTGSFSTSYEHKAGGTDGARNSLQCRPTKTNLGKITH